MNRHKLLLLTFAAAFATFPTQLRAETAIDDDRSVVTTVTLHGIAFPFSVMQDGKLVEYDVKCTRRTHVTGDTVAIRFDSNGRCEITVGDVKLHADALVLVQANAC